MHSEKMKTNYEEFNGHFPAWRLPYFNTPDKQLACQYDHHNCGVACIVFMLDFMLTQYNIVHNHFAFSVEDIEE